MAAEASHRRVSQAFGIAERTRDLARLGERAL
jgi:hypothetical protein